MTNQIATFSAEISTLEAEGKALAKEYKAITRGEKARFNKSTQAEGFDTRLGNLMLQLKAETDGGRISSARLKECGLHAIDKRRRAEALWFVENETACRAFVKASKKGFTSLTALQSAMKPKATPKPPVEPTGSDKPESNVGLNEPEVQEVKAFTQMNAEEIAFEALLQCEVNNIPVKEFMLALKDQLQLVDHEAVA
jgi:hypothetical protein